MRDLIKMCEDCNLAECINCEHSWSDIQEIKQQLAEKDEKTKIWKALAEEYKLQCHKFLENEEYISKTTRHQVCEEIRAFFDVNPDVVNFDYLNEILDQIEKGE